MVTYSFLNFLLHASDNNRAWPIADLRRWMGALLAKDGIPDDFSPRLLVLAGSGMCGKSYLLQALKELVGHGLWYGWEDIPFNKNIYVMNSNIMDRIRLLVIGDYIDIIRKKDNIAYIKSLISNEKVICRKMYSSEILEIKPSCLFVAVDNNPHGAQRMRYSAYPGLVRRSLILNMKPIENPIPKGVLLNNLKAELDYIRGWARNDLIT